MDKEEGVNVNYEAEEDKEKIKLLLGGIKSVTGKATYSIKTIADKSSTDIKSVLSYASTNAVSNLKSVSANAEKGGKEVISAINSASNIASSGIKSSASNLNSIKNNAQNSSKEVLILLSTQAKNSTNIISMQAKSMILQFTNKTKYEFGDITKEILHRLLQQENTIQDTIILLKLLITVSATITPLAKVLPIAILLDALNFSLERQVGGKLLEVLASSLDSKFTAALFTNDDTMQLGDLAKRSVIKAISSFTGKDGYSTGDISQAVKEQIDDIHNNDNESIHPDSLSSNPVNAKKLELNFIGNTEFEQWDHAFMQSQPDDSVNALSYDNTNINNDNGNCNIDNDILLRTTVDNIVRNELDEWDAMFEKRFPPL